MFSIQSAKFLAPGIKRFTVEAPRIARKQQAGQFVIVRLHDHGERIPLTIACSNPEGGTIDLIVQSIGKTTHMMNGLEAGQSILDVVGPLGKPSEVKSLGHGRCHRWRRWYCDRAPDSCGDEEGR